MIKGIHHITAISGDPQKNLEFYSGFLGLRFVKKTVNFDDPYTYHLYYGNETGDPGTIITFFPWGENALKGRKGNGMVTTISYSAPLAGLDFWLKRFAESNKEYHGPFNRFGDEVIIFEDHDGIENEICFTSDDQRKGWDNGFIPEEYSIRGFSGATLTISDRIGTEDLMINHLGFSRKDETANRFRYKSGEGGPGTFIDLLIYPDSPHGRMGVSAVHHIAFRAENDDVQLTLRKRLSTNGLSVTPVINRNYFKSIYFREPGNVLFEIATDPPGFMIDESLEGLGVELKLPEWYENMRGNIENRLPALKAPALSRK